MKEPLKFLNKISPLSQETIDSLSGIFRPTVLKNEEFFIEEGKYAKEIGFLVSYIAKYKII